MEDTFIIAARGMHDRERLSPGHVVTILALADVVDPSLIRSVLILHIAV